jgi:hypothetical protein
VRSRAPYSVAKIGGGAAARRVEDANDRVDPRLASGDRASVGEFQGDVEPVCLTDALGAAGKDRRTARRSLAAKQAARERASPRAGDPTGYANDGDDENHARLPPAAEVEAAIGAATPRLRRRSPEVDDEDESGRKQESRPCNRGERLDVSRQHECRDACNCGGHQNDRQKHRAHENQASGLREVRLRRPTPADTARATGRG